MKTAAPDMIVLHGDDNVATATRDLAVGQAAVMRWPDGNEDRLPLRDAIGLGHKTALADIPQGELVVKHGSPIGRATVDIARGAHVHVHNVISLSRVPA